MVPVSSASQDISSRRLAIGPCLPDFGSWQWLGSDLAQVLSNSFEVSVFDEAPGAADIVLYIKFLPPVTTLRELAQQSLIVYCPVDVYGSAAEIERDAERLLMCQRIVVHAPRLVPYFQSYAPTLCLDHHLKYVIPTRCNVLQTGPILWVGVRSNLPPLVEYVNRHPLPGELVVLTNPETGEDLRDPARLGFHSTNAVQIERWSPESHRGWLARCRAAIDIKGDDFCSRHKPAAKALDFLASGVPLAMNTAASSVEAVQHLGFDIVDPQVQDVWLSAEYAQRTQQFGARISETQALPQLANRWRQIIEEAVATAPRAPGNSQATIATKSPVRERPTRVAIVSLLFNWPSTGGGTIHTAETARFLARYGYELRHIVIRHDDWKLGQVADAVDWPMEILNFEAHEWRRSTIQQRVRDAVRAFAPDRVILTDSWSFKPRLAEAVRELPYYLRLAAQETLCPLNNVRLLWDESTSFSACPRQQLATPDVCHACVQQRGRFSGGLHRAERELAGFGEPDYVESLRRSYAEAAGVLVVNPLIAESVKPFTSQVAVVPSGFDPERFPWPWPAPTTSAEPLKILFAGLVEEPMKGFAVLQAACGLLWSERQDFVLQATVDPVGRANAFTEYVGWQDQTCLPQVLHASDIIGCPTIAEEALGRTAVEAMGVGRPVVASRIGGLPFTVLDEATGLLCEPGDPADLARQLARLLDDAELRERLGQAGRKRFDADYAWPGILDRHYRPLLGSVRLPRVAGGVA